MRKIEPSDLESANYEYIEFWLLDPYLEDETAEGGDLYFNLGEISEDILKDERKFFENGMPVDGDMSKLIRLFGVRCLARKVRDMRLMPKIVSCKMSV